MTHDPWAAFQRITVEPPTPQNTTNPDPNRNPGLLTDTVTARRPAMGSYFEVQIPALVPGALSLASHVLDLIDNLESQLTIYRDDSEVAALNASAYNNPTVVEEGLFQLLEQARWISAWTGGAYDITSGALSQAWGFVRGPRLVPTQEQLELARRTVGWRSLRLNPQKRTVEYLKPGMMINLGSIGKGYAVDRAVAMIKNHPWPANALIHAGRSSAYALGDAPGLSQKPWLMNLRDPENDEEILGGFSLRNRALGVTAATFQWFEHDGIRYGHILDPRTGRPAPPRDLVSVSVLAPTAALADALSTAFYLVGPERAAEIINARNEELGAVYVFQKQSGRPMLRQGVAIQEFLTHLPTHDDPPAYPS